MKSDIVSLLFIFTRRMLPGLGWALALFSVSLATLDSASSQSVAWDYYCGRGTYGSPDLVDCHLLLESFANYQDNVQRVFDEEDMRVDQKGSWPGLIGIVGAAHLNWVVQVPRYYTLRMREPPKSASQARDQVDVLTMLDFRLLQLCNHELCPRSRLFACSWGDKLGESQCWRKLHDDEVSAQSAVGIWRRSRDTEQ